MDTRSTETRSIVERVSRDAKISKTKASKALEALERWISVRLENGEVVEIGSYGRFTTVDKKLDTKASRRVLPNPEIVFIPNPDIAPVVTTSDSKHRKTSTQHRATNTR